MTYMASAIADDLRLNHRGYIGNLGNLRLGATFLRAAIEKRVEEFQNLYCDALCILN